MLQLSISFNFAIHGPLRWIAAPLDVATLPIQGVSSLCLFGCAPWVRKHRVFERVQKSNIGLMSESAARTIMLSLAQIPCSVDDSIYSVSGVQSFGGKANLSGNFHFLFPHGLVLQKLLLYEAYQSVPGIILFMNSSKRGTVKAVSP
jgi:hypothetical protein